ncbi:hypothetical protein ACTNEO_14890 [Gracilibacillus sp. HCP3S3_G5_1]
MMSPVISVGIMLLGWAIEPDSLWVIALTMVIFLLILGIFLMLGYRKKM